MKAMVLLLVVAVLPACQTAIQHGLDEAQANEIEALLTEAGIDARKSSEGGREPKWAIAVPPERTTAAIKLLTDHGLPRQRAPGFSEVFGKGSMVPTAVEENALFLHALSGEIGRTLSALEGVVNARVHVVAAPTNSQANPLRAPVKPRASVLLKVRNGRATALEARLPQIQALVAGSVEGLEPGAVSVMLSELPPPPALAAGDSTATRASGPATGRLALFVGALSAAVLSASAGPVALVIRRKRSRPAAARGEPTGRPSGTGVACFDRPAPTTAA